MFCDVLNDERESQKKSSAKFKKGDRMSQSVSEDVKRGNGKKWLIRRIA
jgi:hypothetical protein